MGPKKRSMSHEFMRVIIEKYEDGEDVHIIDMCCFYTKDVDKGHKSS